VCVCVFGEDGGWGVCVWGDGWWGGGGGGEESKMF